MDVQEMVSQSQDTATVGHVYGEPHEKDSTTVISAARVSTRGGAMVNFAITDFSEVDYSVRHNV